MTTRRLVLAAAAATALAGLGGPAGAGTLEDSVKAAYLVQFLGYVEWPADHFARADAPFVIGVADADGVFDELQQVLPGRRVAGRPLRAHRVEAADALADVHLLFVGRSLTRLRPSWLATLRQRPVLLVTESSDGPALDGAALNFLLVDGRVRFEASARAAERAGLKLSARLLAVAERVQP